MKFVKQLIWLAMSYGGVGQAQEHAHVHGAGSVFVIQEGSNWQVQYVLPASDALGFEHGPENQQQRDSLTNLSRTLMNIENLMYLDGGCEQSEFSHNLDEFKAETEETHEDDEDHETHHQNIEVSYTLRCSNDVTRLSFSIFEKIPSLQKLEVQWSLEVGQGSAMVSNDIIQLELK
ncbi:MAG: DUF2796 domain-containing protein [Paraglaciecola sp.]|nr:DUF2796 domain-containing protein [Paraglaciecola sp.]